MRHFILHGTFALVLGLGSPTVSEAISTNEQLEIAQKEAWQVYMSRVVANQPARVGAKQFVSKVIPSTKAEQFTKLKIAILKNKDWPAVAIEKDALVVSHKGVRTTLELVDVVNMEFKLNGKLLKIDPKQTILSQVEAALSVRQGDLWQRISLIPEAQAGISDTSPTALIHAGAVTGAVAASPMASAGFMFGLGALLETGQAGAVAIMAGTGTVIAVKAAAIGALACGVYAVGDTVIRQDRSVGGNFLNCAASPLSLINKNPRDRLYLADIQCNNEKNELTVKLISPTRREEKRTFTYAGSILKSLAMSEGDKKTKLETNKDGTRFEKGEAGEGMLLYRPRSNKELEALDGLIANGEYYRDLCVGENSDRRRERVLKLIKENTYGERAYDDQSVDDLNRAAQ